MHHEQRNEKGGVAAPVAVRDRLAVAARCLIAGVLATAVCPHPGLAADAYQLHARVGQCEYTFLPQKSERHTKCAAEAYLVNTSTSEVFACRVDVQGDQYVAPSVIENAPHAIVCTRIGQPFARTGTYDIAHTDDHAKAERTLNRMHGSFAWKNAFWTYSRTTNEMKFCATRLSDAGPDYRMMCSKTVEWRK